MFNFRLYSMHEKIYIVSFSATFFGVLLPWLLMVDNIVLGIETLFGILIMPLLIISANVSFFLRSKFKKVSIINILLGVLCLIPALYSYFSYSFVVYETIFRGFIRFGPGIYLTIVGLLGIIISGIVGLIRKGK